MFVYSKPVRVGRKISTNEFSVIIDNRSLTWQDLGLSKTFLTTEFQFPSIYRRSAIVKKETRVLSPIENAISSIEAKTMDISETVGMIEKSVKDGSEENVNISPLSMTLNGVIDAAVNGGITKYREAFLVGDEDNENYPKEMKKKLKDALQEQLQVTGRALGLHASLCTPNMRGLQEKLEDFFVKMKAEILGF